MIPPAPEIRLRSIKRWLTDKTPPAKAEQLDSLSLDLDEQMMESFEAEEDALRDQMMRAKTWGTAAGMQSFPTDRMQLWQQTCQQFLPPITESLQGD